MYSFPQTLDQLAVLIGYFVIFGCAFAFIFWLSIGVAMLGNKALWKLVYHIGSYQTFYEYRDWLNRQDKNGR